MLLAGFSENFTLLSVSGCNGTILGPAPRILITKHILEVVKT